MEAVRARLRGQAERGIRVPKDELPIVTAFLKGALAPGAASPFAVEEARLSALGAARDGGVPTRPMTCARDAARRALEALLADLGPSYAAAAPDTVGLSQYPGGGAAYESLVKLHTTLDVTPEEVHRIGLEEVERIVTRMAEVRRRIGFAGDAAAFREAVRNEPPLAGAHCGARWASASCPTSRASSPRWTPSSCARPKAPFGVKRLDAEREPALTFGIYEPPSPTEPRGLYRFNGSKLEERSLLTAGPLTYHELVPGHHFQIALQDENESLPRFRRELWDTAYVEGWGDYAAGLAEEMGMYEDPYDLYGRLAMDMFISVRLVVDTGMNALGWPRAKAVAYMREHLMESDTQIETESLRYSVDIPGQALAYKMGSRGLWDFRRRAQAALGPRFDVRRFHECLLGSGSLPLDALSRKVDLTSRRRSAREPRPPDVPGHAGRRLGRGPGPPRGTSRRGDRDWHDPQDLRRGRDRRRGLRRLDRLAPAEGRAHRAPPGQVRPGQRPRQLGRRVAHHPHELRPGRDLHPLLQPVPDPVEGACSPASRRPELFHETGVLWMAKGDMASPLASLATLARASASGTSGSPRTSCASAIRRSWCPRAAGPPSSPRAASSWPGGPCRRWWPTR